MASTAPPAIRRLGQGLLVVLSILIAFGIDAAWDESQDRRDLSEHLSTIRLELDENAARVRYQLDMAERMYAAMVAVTGEHQRMGNGAMVPDTSVWLMTQSPTLDASLGAIEALLASGRMASIEDPDLSRRLAGLRGQIEDAVEEQRDSRDLFFQSGLRDIELDDGATTRISELFYAEERVPGRGLAYGGDIPFPMTRELLTIFRWRRGLAYVSIGELRSLLDEFDAIDDLIVRELNH